MTHRPVEPGRDRALLLEAHCEIIFACAPAADRRQPYAAFRAAWLRSGQPEAFVAALAESLEDIRTLAEVAEDPPGVPAAYLWMTFMDIPAYGLVLAEINDLWVAPGRRGCGLGRQMIERMADDARRKGAHRLRSGTGADHAASLRLHERAGFAPHRVEFERLLP